MYIVYSILFFLKSILPIVAGFPPSFFQQKSGKFHVLFNARFSLSLSDLQKQINK